MLLIFLSLLIPHLSLCLSSSLILLRPKYSVLGWLPGTDIYLDIDTYDQVSQTVPALGIM